MCAAEVKGIEDKGIDTIVKHFALNESELGRIELGVWLNEQTAREIYLKAFQTSFEESDANGVMVSYIRWGARWSGGFKNLITGILREEWGCNAWLMTDQVRTTMITAPDSLAAGLTAFDASFPAMLKFNKYKDDVLMLNLMRDACHRNLYSLANSSAMNGIGKNTTVETLELPIVILTRRISIGLAAFTVVFFVKWHKGRKNGKKLCQRRSCFPQAIEIKKSEGR